MPSRFFRLRGPFGSAHRQLQDPGLLADDEMLSLFEANPGEELTALGYPLGAESNSAGFAILRSGKIASYPLLPTEATQKFLFDFAIFPGNSGDLKLS